MRQPFYIIGNWKSHKTIAQADKWLKTFASLWSKNPIATTGIKIILCPAFIHLYPLHKQINDLGLPIILGAQDISAYSEGAYTGEISAQMIKDLVAYTLVGHSERRKYKSETTDELESKFNQSVSANISPIYCIQSPKDQFPYSCRLLAYEPTRAIGTGNPEEVTAVIATKRQIRPSINTWAFIYGGSVTADNVKEYAQVTEIDGVLPGGASLDAAQFYALIQNATQTRQT